MYPSNTNHPQTIELDFERLHLQSRKHSIAPLRSLNWDAACHQYRCFLGLKQLYPALLLVPPTAALQIWQSHILDTRTYRSDCQRLLARFLDHLPALGLYGEADQQQLHAARSACDELLLKHYGAEALLA